MTTRKQKFQINIHIRIEEKSVSAVLFIFVLAGYVNFMSMFLKYRLLLMKLNYHIIGLEIVFKTIFDILRQRSVNSNKLNYKTHPKFYCRPRDVVVY